MATMAQPPPTAVGGSRQGRVGNFSLWQTREQADSSSTSFPSLVTLSSDSEGGSPPAPVERTTPPAPTVTVVSGDAPTAPPRPRRAGAPAVTLIRAGGEAARPTKGPYGSTDMHRPRVRGQRRSSVEQRLSAAGSDVSVDKTLPSPRGSDAPLPRSSAAAVEIPAASAIAAGRPTSDVSCDSLTATSSSTDGGAKAPLPKAKVFMVRAPRVEEDVRMADETVGRDGTPFPDGGQRGEEDLALEELEEDEDGGLFTEVASMATVKDGGADPLDRLAAFPPPTGAKPPPLAGSGSWRRPPPPPTVTDRVPMPARRALKPPVPIPAGVRQSASMHTPRAFHPSCSPPSPGGSAIGPPPAERTPSGLDRVCSASVAALWHGPVSMVDQPESAAMAGVRNGSAPVLRVDAPAVGAAGARSGRRPSGADWDEEDEATRYHRLRWWKNKAPAGDRQSDAAARRAAAALHGEARKPVGGRASLVDTACQVSMVMDDFIEFATGGGPAPAGAAGAGGARADGWRARRLLAKPLQWLQKVQPLQQGTTATQRIKGV
ncbi:hypothetical protein BU14_0382s0006 [Porphyra umbilicalis]|uniref:Uncharacterized protein n=1 Tax=Porphyra umbilicalis TaxID=2786 RepID=A0A1X6NWW9_PORUM|nr:hypothetical protein BU14_0382s0006 [Porphyra umbilicalis]|eukprot:OSX73045.1 hypothetical protein BU14_0382s0006 [Porphyra umbilicalis]